VTSPAAFLVAFVIDLASFALQLLRTRLSAGRPGSPQG
jgi:hypothetical protein